MPASAEPLRASDVTAAATASTGHAGERPSADRVAQPLSPWRTVMEMALKKRECDDLSSGSELRRRLRALDLTMIGVGSSVGAGIFVIVGVAVQPTGPAVSLSFSFAAVASVLSALCYAELAARLPISGNTYLYAYATFGEFFALMFGVNLLLDFHIGAALGGLSCASYLWSAIHGSSPDEGHSGGGSDEPGAKKVLAAALLALLSALLCLGVENGLRRANGLLVSMKVAIVLLIIFVGVGHVDMENLQPFAPFGFAPVASTSALCCFSYIGFGTVASAAEECINPQRDLPIGITASLLVCAALYVAFSLVLCGLMPFREIDPAAPVAEAFGPRYANVRWIGFFVNWGAVLGIFTTLLTGLYSQARIYFAMSRDGLLPKAFCRISRRFGTPVAAQLFCGLFAALLSSCLPLERLVRWLNVGVLSSYAIVCAGVLALRAERPDSAAAAGAGLGLGSVVAAFAAQWAFSSTTSASPVLRTAVLVAALVLPAASSVPLLRQRYSRPGTFACPGCPIVPMLGVIVNGYLLAQCHWEAWLRLAFVAAAIVLSYAIRLRRVLSSAGAEAAAPPSASTATSALVPGGEAAAEAASGGSRGGASD